MLIRCKLILRGYMIMKTLLALVIVSLLWSSAVNAQKKTDKDQAGLIGSVKSVEVYIIDFVMKDGKIEQGERRHWHSTTYNPGGNIIERLSYDPLGHIAEKLVYTYDTRGRNTGYEEYPAILDKTLTIPRKHIYTLMLEAIRLNIESMSPTGL